jgi:Transglutaminase-like superfamily
MVANPIEIPPRRCLVVLNLERLRNPTDAECAGFDLAAIDLACAVGLPGSERLDIPACLAWVDHAAAWVSHQTVATFEQFRRSPGTYEDSEGIFRVVAMMNVLWRGLGVQYNRERIDNPDEFTDSRDDFIHGIIEGRGGTCASLPVLLVAVGRRLGYPLRLVKTARHLFARWDDPVGERFNVEINQTGLNTHPDEHYLTWPIDIRGTKWQAETKFLRSLTPREEVARAWSKRGHNLRAGGRLKEAVDCFATACSIVTDDRLLDLCLWGLLKQRREVLNRKIPSVTPKLRIYFPPRRRYPGLPIETERDVIALEVLEGLLDEPIPEVEQVVRCVLN